MMFWVHVNPGLSNASVISTGELSAMGAVLGGWLGRASVAALSFISGYVMIGALRRDTPAGYAVKRFRTIVVPMLVWNLIYIAAQSLSWALDASEPRPVFDLAWLATEATGLLGPTANLSLFFLRDLFVAGCIAYALAPVLERAPGAVLACALVLALLDPVAPLLFRPTILLFLLAGLAAAQRRIALGALSRPRIAVPGIVLPALLSLALSSQLGEGTQAAGAALDPAQIAAGLANILKRVALVFAVFLVTRWLARGPLRSPLMRLEPGMFTAYLCHVIFIGTLWMVWRGLVGDEHAPSYALFFLAAPFAALAFGQALDAVLRRCPGVLQRLLRGRAYAAGARGRRLAAQD